MLTVKLFHSVIFAALVDQHFMFLTLTGQGVLVELLTVVSHLVGGFYLFTTKPVHP